MIPKHIIEKAIEGGWKSGFELYHWDAAIVVLYQVENHLKEELLHEQIALLSEFWVCLGKTLGWKADKGYKNIRGTQIYRRIWLQHARKFYDLILTGQPNDAFWRDLSSEA